LKYPIYAFDEDRHFASVEPVISGYKYRDNSPIGYAHDREGFDIKTIEDAAGALVISNDPNIRPRVIIYNEFYEKYRNDELNKSEREALERIAERLSYFDPETKGVFWRAMLAQAHLYQFLESSRKPQFYKYFREPDSEDKEPLTFEVFKSMSKIKSDDLNWHKLGTEYGKNDADTFEAVDKYLSDKLNDLLDNEKSSHTALH
jgi:hypothetical protein